MQAGRQESSTLSSKNKKRVCPSPGACPFPDTSPERESRGCLGVQRKEQSLLASVCQWCWCAFEEGLVAQVALQLGGISVRRKQAGKQDRSGSRRRRVGRSVPRDLQSNGCGWRRSTWRCVCESRFWKALNAGERAYTFTHRAVWEGRGNHCIS